MPTTIVSKSTETAAGAGRPAQSHARPAQAAGVRGHYADKLEYIYILSASHSGSTLLTMLLSSYPEIATVGETSAVTAMGTADVGLCSCGLSIQACDFWKQVRAGMKHRGIDMDAAEFTTEFRVPGCSIVDRILRAEYRGPLFELARDIALSLSPKWRTASNLIRLANTALIEAVTKLRNGTVFIDSSKEPHRLKFMLAAEELHARVIHLVRDGRGVTTSYMKKSSWPVDRAANEWRRAICSQQAMVRRFRADDVCFIRYEDLCTDPRSIMERVASFLNLKPLEPSQWGSRLHHVLGNRMRMEGLKEIKLDERWKTALTAEQQRTFARIAGAQNRFYGYE